MGVANVKEFMLKERRQYVIEKVKAPIMKALIVLANRLPEPTMQNTFHPNTHVWLSIWDKFFEMEDNPNRESLFKAISRVQIAETEHDIYYRDRMNVLLELWLDEVLKGNWKPRSLDHPNECWKVDPNVRGDGFEFMSSRYKHKETL